ncbi:MAG: tRNA dihydrouridine synthase DusB [Oscillospiraceae bacterium]|jgi:nifR3 family TIM-barrel protein|nr:tRNA dihydrouridine synthase DusB [Oscillospiraceae bacterium]
MQFLASLKTSAALAPMAGVADRAFRELCRSYGAAFTVSEMVSSKGLIMTDRKSVQLMALSPAERPAGIQLFGSEPAAMAQAALRALRETPAFLDINMGCPAPKIAGGGGGAALMKSPELAARIVEKTVRAAGDVPVSVKMRAGWDDASRNAVDLAKRCEAAGAAFLTVHGRTRQQMYAPPVDREIIRQVKAAVRIPVLANGDVTDGSAAQAMLDKTGCDGCLVGRGAMGRPWVFAQIAAYLRDGTMLPDPPLPERMRVLREHMTALCGYKGDRIGMCEARKHAAWYLKGIRGAAKFRQEIGALNSLDELDRLIDRVLRAETMT